MNDFIANLLKRASQDDVQKLSVGCALMCDDTLLVLKRMPNDFMPNIYELPGGALEPGESLLEALHRELKEETNGTIDSIVGYIGHIDFLSSTGLLTRRFNFLVKPVPPLEIKLTEHSDYKWILPEQAHLHAISPQTQGIIRALHAGKYHTF